MEEVPSTRAEDVSRCEVFSLLFRLQFVGILVHLGPSGINRPLELMDFFSGVIR